MEGRNYSYGTVWITDGLHPIRVKKDEVDNYLSEGYELGRLKINSRVWINNGIIEKKIVYYRYPDYVSKGFILGRLQD